MNQNIGEDHNILSALGVALLSRTWEGSIVLLGTEPSWFAELFVDLWDRETQILSIPEFSALDSFLNCDPEKNQSMRFEERLPDGNWLNCVITACGNGIFALKPVENIAGCDSSRIQSLRETALKSTSFGKAKRRRNGTPRELIDDESTLTASILSNVISTVRDALIVLNADGQLIQANNSAHELFPNLSNSKSQLETGSAWDLMALTTISKKRLQSVALELQNGIDESIETSLELPLPIRQTWDTRILPVTTPDGDFGGSIWSLRKQEGAKDFLEQISQSERLEVVGRLAGGVAHDFNNLLAIVMGNLSLLSDSADDQGLSDIKETAGLAMEAAEKAAGMVRQLLGFSRKSRLDREITRLDGILEKTASLFRSTAGDGIGFTLDLKTEDWKIDADNEKLGQVFLNMFENAAQAMQGLGEINVTARTFVVDDPDMAGAMECEQGHYLVVNITDNGPGMSKEVREKVFEPFFTTKEVGKGTGLGLANAMGIVRQHGGHISCTSIPGEGTAFTIYLPRERDETRRRDSIHDAATRERKLDRVADESTEPAILVVDDEEMLRNVVRTMLHKHGYRTIGAIHGKNALEIIKLRKHEIAAIILDLAMPEMSGNELFRELNALDIHIPVIVATGYLVDTEKFIREAGAPPAGFLSKPYQLEELLSKVREQLPEGDTSMSDKIALPR